MYVNKVNLASPTRGLGGKRTQYSITILVLYVYCTGNPIAVVGTVHRKSTAASRSVYVTRTTLSVGLSQAIR